MPQAGIGGYGVAERSTPFISVVVPTYNRAAHLERQLHWLFGELSALTVSWEVCVHDNCSTDDTPAVTAKWQHTFGPGRLRVVRNRANIGGIPNLAAALADARGRWVWSVGDDDDIVDGTTAHVVDLLRSQPDLALLYLNFRGVDVAGVETNEHYFDPAVSGRIEDGRQAFMYHSGQDLGSVIFLTATVYRTELVQDAMRSWKGEIDNWALVAYWTGYVAARGPVYITPEIVIDCLVGVSHWSAEPGAYIKAVYADIPKVFLRLNHEGYPKEFCQRVGYEKLKRRVRWRSLKNHVQALYYCPKFILTLTALAALHQRSTIE